MTRCSVPSCSNNANHHFPKDARLRKCWLKAIRRVDFVPKNGARICRQHFHESDYVKISNYTGLALQHRFLKKYAVPSIFPWTGKPVSSLNLSREKRIKSHHSRKHRDDDIVSTSKMLDSNQPDQEHRGGFSKSTIETRPVEIKRITRGTQTSNVLRLFASEQLLTDDESVHFYTGLDNYAQFSLLLSTLLPMANEIKYRSRRLTGLCLEDQFLMLIIKLRRSKPDFEIGKMFGVNKTDVSVVIITWVSFLTDNWSVFDVWPNQNLVNKYMPLSFKGNCPSNGAITNTTDTSLRMDSPRSAHKNSFSQYKFKNTMKYLGGSATEGLITYCFDGNEVSAREQPIVDPVPISSMFNVELLKNVHIDSLISSTKTYKLLACPLNQTYAPLSSKIFSICIMICLFKEATVNVNKGK